MTPRWKIRRVWDAFDGYVWMTYLDDVENESFFLLENAITHVDSWFYEQKLRSEP